MKKGKKKTVKRKVGRSTKYTKKKGALICEIISCSNKSLSTICKDERINVSLSTVFLWLNQHKEFSDNYARAKEMQADFLAEEILEIADEKTNDSLLVDLGDGVTVEKENHEYIQRSRLRVDARKWIASKLKPKKYGDKLDVGITPPEARERVASLFPTEEEFKDVLNGTADQ